MQDQGILPRVCCLYQKMYEVWEMCRQWVSWDISSGEHLPYLSAYLSAAWRFTSLWKIDGLFYPLDGYSPNIAFLLLMPPSMWGHPDNISDKEKNKKKDTVCYQWKCSRWYIVFAFKKKEKKIKIPEKHKNGRMDLLLNCEQWVVLNWQWRNVSLRNVKCSGVWKYCM